MCRYIKNCLAFLPHSDLALLVVHTDLGVEPHTRNLAHMARSGRLGGLSS